MEEPLLSRALAGLRVHLVGAKGTGMAALAELLASRGALLSGSDVPERFYTDAILAAIGLKPAEGFDAANLPPDAALVVHSAAYARDKNPELLEAARRGIPILSYPEALGALSAAYDASGVAGVHGKTTTTAMAGCLALGLGLPASVVVGSAVSNFGGRATLVLGERFLVAETCEYRRHFLHFHPRRILLTSIESDHQDCFPTYEDIYAAFRDYGLRLPAGGELIYCADDPGASSLAAELGALRPDLRLVPYGFTAEDDYGILAYETGEGRASFRLRGFAEPFELRLPGRHLALDATGALALAASLLAAREGRAPGSPPSAAESAAARAALAAFSGSKRRAEILGEAGGILFMDDYGHHPTAVRETVRGIKAFWPGRRLVLDFMSHTYSRTKALFEDFAASLDEAELLVLHKIYASAREAPDPAVSGRKLAEAAQARRPGRTLVYAEEPMEAVEELAGLLRPGDLFLTMGAGDNWRLGEALLERFRTKG